MLIYRTDAEAVTVILTVDVVSGQVVVVNGLVGVAQATALAGNQVSLVRQGEFIFPKTAGFAVAVGDVLGYDIADVAVNQDVTTNVVRVLATQAALSGDTKMKGVLLFDSTSDVENAEVQFNLRPSSGVVATVAFDWTAPAAGKFDLITMRTNARPSSAAGTVLETITNLTGSLNVLTAASIDLDTGIVNDTTLTPALSATPANLTFAAGDVIRFAIAANNADVVAGGGISHLFRWHRT